MYSSTGRFPDGYCVYKTRMENQPVLVISKKQYVDSVRLEDETEILTPGTGGLSYTFKDKGEHIVKFTFKDGITDLSSCFESCDSLASISDDLFLNVPNLTSVRGCFSSCAYLESIPSGLFVNNKKIEDFTECFNWCSGCSGVTPSGDGYELWERAGVPGYPQSITGTRCFFVCRALNNYSLIPSDWK